MRNYSFQIDILRAVAVLLVVLFHFNVYISIIPLWNDLILKGGLLGVNIFFIISGLLISKPFIEKSLISQSLPNLKVYIINRLFRIMPLFLITSSIFFLCRNYIELYAQSPYPITLFDFIKFIFFFFGKNDLLNVPVWTLRFEILFYIFFPIVFISTLRFHFNLQRHLKKITVCLFVFFLLYRFWYLKQYNSSFYYNFLSNLEGFLLGVLLSFLYTNENFKKYFNLKFSILTPVCFLFIILKLNTISFFNTKYTIAVFQTLCNASLFFLFIGLLNVKIIYNKCLFCKLISYISLISYSIYLLHFNVYYNIIIPLSKLLFNNDVNKFVLGIVALFITVFFSTITYFLIEKPALQLKSKYIS